MPTTSAVSVEGAPRHDVGVQVRGQDLAPDPNPDPDPNPNPRPFEAHYDPEQVPDPNPNPGRNL